MHIEELGAGLGTSLSLIPLAERLGDVRSDAEGEHGEAAAAEGELHAAGVGGRRVALQVRRTGLAPETG